MAEAAKQYVEWGFPALKVRFSRADWREDVARVAAVRATVGDRLALMVDCNQGWRMPWDAASPWPLETATEVARALEDLGVYWMEEPLHRADYDGMRTLRRRAKVRLAGGELNRQLFEYDTLLERDCLDVYQPDASLIGGLTALAPLARRVRERGLAFTPHTWGDGLAVIANAHLAAGIGGVPYLEFPFDPPEWTLQRRDFMLAEPLAATADGHVALGEKPGFGIELDEERLASTRIA